MIEGKTGQNFTNNSDTASDYTYIRDTMANPSEMSEACWCALPSLTGSTECCKNCHKNNSGKSETRDSTHIIINNPPEFEPIFTASERTTGVTNCLICGENIYVNDFGSSQKLVCEKCKKAIMKIREEMEE